MSPFGTRARSSASSSGMRGTAEVRKMDSGGSSAIAQPREYGQVSMPVPSWLGYLCVYEMKMFFCKPHRAVLRSLR